MKHIACVLLLLTIAVPSHAAPLRRCRTAAAARSNHVRSAASTRAANHHATQSNVVVTAFAVPVAVPIAPFASYWYGVADYQDPRSSFPHAASQRNASEAHPRAQARHNDSQSTPLVTLRCASCHGAVSPKQGLSLVDPPSLSAENRLRAIRAVVQGTMPPDTEPALSDDDRAALLQELTAD